jgi:osmotically-inducible protein OsmY
MTKILTGFLAGAAAEFFLDPHGGRRRRHVARDKVRALLRRGSRQAARKARYAEGVAEGVAHRAFEAAGQAKPDGQSPPDLNDATLARKVESEIFRDREAPKGHVDVNAENGVVYLRGQVEDPDQMRALVEAASQVDGVTAVENLLHLPGGPVRAKNGERRVVA